MAEYTFDSFLGWCFYTPENFYIASSAGGWFRILEYAWVGEFYDYVDLTGFPTFEDLLQGMYDLAEDWKPLNDSEFPTTITIKEKPSLGKATLD